LQSIGRFSIHYFIHCGASQNLRNRLAQQLNNRGRNRSTQQEEPKKESERAKAHQLPPAGYASKKGAQNNEGSRTGFTGVIWFSSQITANRCL